jgi:two-component system response regulator FlrC
MTAYGTVQNAVEAMREGAADYLVKPFDAATLVSKVAHYVQNRPATGEPELVAVDPRTRALVDLAGRVAANDVTVLITGESGSGKEVLARYIHRRSRRSAGPFVAINCAAIPDNMLEAVLFGYEKGAFTGAVQACPGKFEQAQAGTLLLDEISEMNLGLQAKLLRVLQEREVERLGGRRTVALDVRVLATSNRVLREEVAAGRFREDLYYRLNVFPLALPPLRERRADIVPLAERLLVRHARAAGRAAPRLSASAAERLLAHDWPGNVRELENLIQRALVLCAGDAIAEHDLSFETAPIAPAPAEGLGHDLRAREQQLILDALAAEGGRRKQAAERLGISPRTLRYKLARLREAGIAVPG